MSNNILEFEKIHNVVYFCNYKRSKIIYNIKSKRHFELAR